MSAKLRNEIEQKGNIRHTTENIFLQNRMSFNIDRINSYNV